MKNRKKAKLVGSSNLFKNLLINHGATVTKVDETHILLSSKGINETLAKRFLKYLQVDNYKFKNKIISTTKVVSYLVEVIETKEENVKILCQ